MNKKKLKTILRCLYFGLNTIKLILIAAVCLVLAKLITYIETDLGMLKVIGIVLIVGVFAITFELELIATNIEEQQK